MRDGPSGDKGDKTKSKSIASASEASSIFFRSETGVGIASISLKKSAMESSPSSNESAIVASVEELLQTNSNNKYRVVVNFTCGIDPINIPQFVKISKAQYGYDLSI